MGMPIVIPYGTNKGVYQVKNVTPKATEQSIVADEGYMALSQVIVTGDADLVSSNIKKDVTIFGVTGTLEGGGIALSISRMENISIMGASNFITSDNAAAVLNSRSSGSSTVIEK